MFHTSLFYFLYFGRMELVINVIAFGETLLMARFME